MNTHELIQDLLAPYALGTLSPGERATVEIHTADCEACRRTLADFQAAADMLPASVPPVQPPARVKSELMAKIRPPRPKTWMRSLALAASILLAIGLSALWKRQTPPAPLQIVRMAGTIHVDGKTVLPPVKVRQGRAISAGPASSADIQVASNAVFRLSPDSEATVIQENGGYVVNLEKGSILSLVKSGTSYKVKTPWITASALGTVFYVQTDAPDQFSLCICRGSFRIDGPGFSREMSGRHNHLTLLVASGQTRESSPAPLRHSDREIAELEKLLK